MADPKPRRRAGRVAGLAVAAAIVGFVVWQRADVSSETSALDVGESARTSKPAAARIVMPEIRGDTMGTTYVVKLGVLPEGLVVAELGSAIADAVEAVDASMSNYRADSELSELNRAASGQAISVSAPLYAVLELSQRVAAESEGAFDVTVAPLVDAYGFGPGQATNDPAELARRRALVDYRALVLLPDSQVRKDRDGLACTLSAVAKGFAVDQVAELLEARGLTSYMVEIGGEVRVSGRKGDGSPWRLGIERPATDAGAAPQVYRALTLDAGAMATSGDYRNYREVDGRRVSHTLDPRTGEPITHTLASVSVVHAQAAAADAYATAVDVLGPEAGLELANRLELAAFLLVRRGDGYEERMTPAFAKLVEASSP